MSASDLVDTWQEGAGSPFASPLLPPELGGQWGISTEVMQQRPGFRSDRAEDLARAAQLVEAAGIGDEPLDILTSVSFRVYGEVVDANLRAAGFTTTLNIQETTEVRARLQRGDFDIYLISASINIDDPSDTLSDFVITDAPQNYGGWSWPELDTLLIEQDRVLDATRRREMLVTAQTMVLDEHFGAFIPTLVRLSPVGHQPWVKNAPSGLPFLHSPWYRWEQVWLERAS